MSTASFYDLQSDAIQVVLHVFIQNGGAAAEVYPIFQKKERFCGVTKNVSPKIFEIDPHHADKNLQADVFNGVGGYVGGPLAGTSPDVL